MRRGLTGETLLEAIKEMTEAFSNNMSDWCILINPFTYYENEESFKELCQSIEFVKEVLCPLDKAYVIQKKYLEKCLMEGIEWVQ